MKQINVDIKWGDEPKDHVGIGLNVEDIDLPYEDWFERYWKPATMCVQNYMQKYRDQILESQSRIKAV